MPLLQNAQKSRPSRYLEDVRPDPKQRGPCVPPRYDPAFPAARPMSEAFTPAAEARLDKLFDTGLVTPSQLLGERSSCFEALLKLSENEFMCAIDAFYGMLLRVRPLHTTSRLKIQPNSSSLSSPRHPSMTRRHLVPSRTTSVSWFAASMRTRGAWRCSTRGPESLRRATTGGWPTSASTECTTRLSSTCRSSSGTKQARS